MKLNRTWAMVAAIVMALTLSLSGTLAYLQDSDSDVNVMTLGNVDIIQNEQMRNAEGKLVAFDDDNLSLYPAVYESTTNNPNYNDPSNVDRDVVNVNGTNYNFFSTDDVKNAVDKIVSVTNTGKSDAYVRTLFAFEHSDPNGDDNYDDGIAWKIHTVYYQTETQRWVTYANNPLDYVKIGDKVYSIASYTYTDALAPNTTSTPSLLQVFLDKSATNEDMKPLGDSYEILVLSQAVQTAGFDSAEEALNEAFGDINVDNVKTWFANLVPDSPGDEFPNNNPPTNYFTVSDTESLNAALAAGETNIYLEAGDYTLPTSLKGVSLTANGDAKVAFDVETLGSNNGVKLGNNVTLSGIEFDVKESSNNDPVLLAVVGENVTIEDCSFDTTSTNSTAIGIGGGTDNTVIKGCEFTNGYKQIGPLSGTPGDIIIEDCTFGGTNSAYAMHLQVTTNNVTIKNSNVSLMSTFYGTGTDTGKLTFENCTFSKIVNDNWNGVKLYRNADFVDCEFNGYGFSDPDPIKDKVTRNIIMTFENCTSNGKPMVEHFRSDSYSNTDTVTVVIDDDTTMVWNGTAWE